MNNNLRLYKAVFAAMNGDAKAFKLLEEAGYTIVHKADFFRIAIELFGKVGHIEPENRKEQYDE